MNQSTSIIMKELESTELVYSCVLKVDDVLAIELRAVCQ